MTSYSNPVYYPLDFPQENLAPDPSDLLSHLEERWSDTQLQFLAAQQKAEKALIAAANTNLIKLERLPSPLTAISVDELLSGTELVTMAQYNELLASLTCLAAHIQSWQSATLEPIVPNSVVAPCSD